MFILAMCPGLGIALRMMGRFFDVWPDIIQFGRITSDVITGMSVTDFTTVGHVATHVVFTDHSRYCIFGQ